DRLRDHREDRRRLHTLAHHRQEERSEQQRQRAVEKWHQREEHARKAQRDDHSATLAQATEIPRRQDAAGQDRHRHQRQQDRRQRRLMQDFPRVERHRRHHQSEPDEDQYFEQYRDDP